MAAAVASGVIQNVDVIANVGYTTMNRMAQAIVIFISLIILFVGLILLCYGKYFDGSVWFGIGALGMGGTIYWIHSAKDFSQSAAEIRASRQQQPAYSPPAYAQPAYSYPPVSYAPQAPRIHPGYTNPYYYQVGRADPDDLDVSAASYLPELVAAKAPKNKVTFAMDTKVGGDCGCDGKVTPLAITMPPVSGTADKDTDAAVGEIFPALSIDQEMHKRGRAEDNILGEVLTLSQ